MGYESRFHDGHIVVVGQWREGQGGRLPLPYVDAVRAAGGDAVIYSTFELGPEQDHPAGYEAVMGLEPDDTSPLDDAAGLVLPGGGDIDPARYKRPRHPQSRAINHRRDNFELNLLGEALERDLPVLAICHGMQLLNVHFGGTLHQHLADLPGRVEHDVGWPSPIPIHGVKVVDDSPLAAMLGATRVQTNSHHHQGLDHVPAPLEECAWAEDGVLEGIVSTAHSFVVGVQWHPEVMIDHHEQQLQLFNSFVAAAGQYSVTDTVRATA
jgi:gamma-glutamyl-gamma-aminobutyrate hydrolase PuuD